MAACACFARRFFSVQNTIDLKNTCMHLTYRLGTPFSDTAYIFSFSPSFLRSFPALPCHNQQGEFRQTSSIICTGTHKKKAIQSRHVSMCHNRRLTASLPTTAALRFFNTVPPLPHTRIHRLMFYDQILRVSSSLVGCLGKADQAAAKTAANTAITIKHTQVYIYPPPYLSFSLSVFFFLTLCFSSVSHKYMYTSSLRFPLSLLSSHSSVSSCFSRQMSLSLFLLSIAALAHVQHSFRRKGGGREGGQERRG